VARLVLALVVALLAPAWLAGCGGDDEQAEAPENPPELTVPRTTPEPARTETTGTTETTTTGEDPATAPLAPGEGDGGAAPPEATPDSPQNDTAPPAGSPAERFEQECEANPAACG
jgi:hypothetical protein